MSRTPIVAANWKMHKTAAEAAEFIRSLSRACAGEALLPEVVICAPYTALEALAGVYSHPIRLGAQNVHWEPSGAFTGEVSTSMLAEHRVSHVIVGHSERRQYFAETDESVGKRLAAALAGGLTPICCVGESREERDKGRTEEVVSRQIGVALEGCESVDLSPLIVAYEPVWAIGTGVTPTPEEAAAVHRQIRSELARRVDEGFASRVRIQYGGSVNASNAADFFVFEDIDGALVGGASLEVESFRSILAAAKV